MSKDTVRMALHNPAAWPGSRTDDADEVIRLRGELAAALAKLDAANERARLLAGDLATMMHENAAQAVIIGKLNHTCDELHYQMRLWAGAGGKGLLTLTDRGGIEVFDNDYATDIQGTDGSPWRPEDFK